MRRFFIVLCCLVTIASGRAQITCPPGQSLITVDITPDFWPNENWWDLAVPPIFSPSLLIAVGDTSFCYASDSCLVFTMYDLTGDGMFTGGYTLLVNNVPQVSYTAVPNQNWSGRSEWFNCGPGQSCTNALSVTPGGYVASVADSWYVFQPDSSGIYSISTCGTNSCDTRIWVYDHCQNLYWTNNNLGTVFYNDNSACGLQAVITAAFDPAQTYYIRIGQADTSCTGAINWSLTYQGPVVGCMDSTSCNYAPLATIDDGSCLYYPDPNCPGPDLKIEESQILNSIYLAESMAQHCQVEEGCMNGYGWRDILTFTTHIKNIGALDHYIGVPSASNPQFTFDNCHGHWHYSGYAAYLLYDMSGNALPIGFKNGFCVMDLECNGGGNAQYGCGNMGISHGCGDIYGAGSSCQWLDLTDVDTGVYQLVVIVNWDRDPDALGRPEVTYDNNWASVCIHFTRDAAGIPSFTFVPNCPDFTDCMGVTYGPAKKDCNGVCNGPAQMGDMNNDTALTQPDAQLYVDALINHTIIPSLCKDMDADGVVTVHDAALINNCVQNGPSVGNDRCDFPFGITNILDTVTLAISNVDFTNQFVDISIKNPYNKTIAYQFLMHGIHITGVDNLLNVSEYNITPQFAPAFGEVIGISYDQMMVGIHPGADALCRLHYDYVTDTIICIDSIVDIVNQHYQASVSLIGGQCVMVPSIFSVGEEGSTISAHLYPNPVQDMLHINLGLSETDDVQLEIMDELGRKVLEQMYPDVYVKTVDVDLGSLSNGVYMVSLRTGKGKITRRVVLNR